MTYTTSRSVVNNVTPSISKTTVALLSRYLKLFACMYWREEGGEKKRKQMVNCITLLLVETCHVDLFVALIFTQKWFWRNFFTISFTLFFFLLLLLLLLEFNITSLDVKAEEIFMNKKIGLICSVHRGGFIELFFLALFFHYFVSWRDRKFLSLLARCWVEAFSFRGEKKKARVSFCPSSLVTLFSLVSRLAFKSRSKEEILFYFFFSLLF